MDFTVDQSQSQTRGRGSKIPKNWPDVIHGWFLATVLAHQLIELLKSL